MFPQGAPSWIEVFNVLWTPRAGVFVFLAALILSLLATPVFRWIALRKNICDQPDAAVKIHRAPIPYLGGCAIWLAWSVPVLVYALFSHTAHGLAAAALLLGGLIAFVTGLVDDLKDIRPYQKILGQMLAAAVLWGGGIRWWAYPQYPDIPLLNLPEGSVFVYVACLAVHFMVVIGATNATNLVDGLDGLCSGITVMVAMGFLMLATSLAAWARPEWFPNAVQYEFTGLIMVAAFALVGAAIGFLPYNFNPARIFMGDAGSVFIGYVLAAMMVMFSSSFGQMKWFVGALFIFGVPILDTGVTLIRRLVNRRPIMMPDRSHLYNDLVDRLGLSVRATVGIMYALSALFAAAGLLVLYLRGRWAVLLYLLVGVTFLIVVWRLGFLKMTEEEKAAADRYLARNRGK